MYRCIGALFYGGRSGISVIGRKGLFIAVGGDLFINDGHYSISDNYHLVCLSSNEGTSCKRKSLTSHRDWIYLFDEHIFLRGPFDFATFGHQTSKDIMSIGKH